MRITSPPVGARVKLDQINLADVDLYTKGDAHLVWRTLRAECPVFWQERAVGEGFWAVTRQADVRRVLAEHATFTSESGTAIAMLDAPDPAAGKMMQSTDPPRHYRLRQQIGKPFTPHDIRSHVEYIKSLVRKALEPARDGEVWDSASSFVRLPMAVGARMMGLPESDVDPLLRLAYASLAPHDPHYRGRALAADRGVRRKARYPLHAGHRAVSSHGRGQRDDPRVGPVGESQELAARVDGVAGPVL